MPNIYSSILEPPAGGVRPVIDDSQPTVTISQGETTELPCAATQAYPTPKFSWQKDGVALTFEDWRLAQRGGNLLVRNATVHDSGEYICTGVNNHGEDSAVTQLIVTCKFIVTYYPFHITYCYM